METQGLVKIVPAETKSNEIVCQKKRNQFLNCLKYHFHLLKILSAEHKKFLDRMFVLSAKLNVIESDNPPKCLPYTKELLWKVKAEILNAINSIMSRMNQNLQQLSSSFYGLRQNHEEFIISSKAVDWNNGSRLSQGSATEKPLFYYAEHSFDIMYSLHIYEKTMQLNKLQLNVRDANLITRFLNAVSLSQNLHDLMTDVLLNSYFVDKTEKVRNKS